MDRALSAIETTIWRPVEGGGFAWIWSQFVIIVALGLLAQQRSLVTSLVTFADTEKVRLVWADKMVKER